MDKATRFLVVDDLALELHEHPIHVPIPKSVKTEKQMREFTKKVYADFMKLPYFSWYHGIGDVVVDGFTVRHHLVYPGIST